MGEDGPELLRQLRTGGEPARGGPAASQHKHEHRQQILGCEIQGGSRLLMILKNTYELIQSFRVFSCSLRLQDETELVRVRTQRTSVTVRGLRTEKRGTKRVLEYSRLAMGFAHVRASRYGIR